jgi:hypothetical protein
VTRGSPGVPGFGPRPNRDGVGDELSWRTATRLARERASDPRPRREKGGPGHSSGFGGSVVDSWVRRSDDADASSEMPLTPFRADGPRHAALGSYLNGCHQQPVNGPLRLLPHDAASRPIREKIPGKSARAAKSFLYSVCDDLQHPLPTEPRSRGPHPPTSSVAQTTPRIPDRPEDDHERHPDDDVSRRRSHHQRPSDDRVTPRRGEPR